MPAVFPETQISALGRVGSSIAKRLSYLGLETVQDLLFYYPFRYETFYRVPSADKLQPGELSVFEGTVEKISGRRGKNRVKYITTAYLCDAKGDTVGVVWFNQPYLSKTLHDGEMIRVSGRLEYDLNGLKFINPSIERVSKEAVERSSEVSGSAIVPVYSLTAGLTQKQMRYVTRQALEKIVSIPETLPEELKKKYALIPKDTALRHIHFPPSQEALASARRRLMFDELFLVQLQNLAFKKIRAEKTAFGVPTDLPKIQQCVRELPYELTSEQKKAAWQILQDISQTKAMNRLLQGEVGSGKTIVAALAMYNTALSERQSVLLAPTEVLCRQHYENFKNLFGKSDIHIGLLTGSICESTLSGSDAKESYASRRKQMVRDIKEKNIDMVIGTHALLSSDVVFTDLSLVVVDEQQRFGVTQRQKMHQKIAPADFFPHLLSLSATPIPRTLALTLYGELEISRIKEMPKGRTEIKTFLVKPTHMASLYEKLAAEMRAGRQVYVLCPLIEESDFLGVASVTAEHEKMKKIFPEFELSVLHGKMSSVQKEQVMQKFTSGEVKMLLTTSVIEVGVDVKNASVMVILGAERFGLSQLHQLRGRVGRGEHASFCFLVVSKNETAAYQRLSYVVESLDGFFLARKDLETRGPGEVFGTQQSGFPEFKLASLSDTELIEKTHEAAEALLAKKDWYVECEELAKILEEKSAVFHRE